MLLMIDLVETNGVCAKSHREARKYQEGNKIFFVLIFVFYLTKISTKKCKILAAFSVQHQHHMSEHDYLNHKFEFGEPTRMPSLCKTSLFCSSKTLTHTGTHWHPQIHTHTYTHIADRKHISAAWISQCFLSKWNCRGAEQRDFLVACCVFLANLFYIVSNLKTQVQKLKHRPFVFIHFLHIDSGLIAWLIFSILMQFMGPHIYETPLKIMQSVQTLY